MKLSAHQLNFLPYPGLIAKINYSDQFIYLTKIQFEKKLAIEKSNYKQ